MTNKYYCPGCSSCITTYSTGDQCIESGNICDCHRLKAAEKEKGNALTPSPKPCCDSCRSKTIPYKCYAEDCPNCHQAKPDNFYVDSRTPEERQTEAGIKSVTTSTSPEVSPAKEEKEVCTNSLTCSKHPMPKCDPKEEKCECINYKDGALKLCGNHKIIRSTYAPIPTLTEQKGESWEVHPSLILSGKLLNEFDISPKKTAGIVQFVENLYAAKKKEWEAQKEQAVKAEIREKIETIVLETDWANDWGTGINKLSSLLSDKVNH